MIQQWCLQPRSAFLESLFLSFQKIKIKLILTGIQQKYRSHKYSVSWPTHTPKPKYILHDVKYCQLKTKQKQIKPKTKNNNNTKQPHRTTHDRNRTYPSTLQSHCLKPRFNYYSIVMIIVNKSFSRLNKLTNSTNSTYCF